MRRSSNPNLDGYVFLSPKEQREAESWMRSNANEIEPEDKGSHIGSDPIIYGLSEDEETGLLTTPRIENEESEQDQSRHEMSKDAEWHSELLERTMIKRSIPKHKIRLLNDREKRVLFWWFRGLSQVEISKLMEMKRMQIQRALDSAFKKVSVACPKSICA
jgi:DNA-directed RNA polymerase specialized sigma subunit